MAHPIGAPLFPVQCQLRSPFADVRSTDDVIAFEGLYYVAFFRQGLNNERNASYTTLFGSDKLRDTCGEQGDCMGMLSMQVLILVISMPFFKVVKENMSVCLK